MKKIIFSFAVVLATTVGLISWKALETGNGAVHASGSDCVFVTKKSGSGDMGFITGTYKYVETPSGNATLTCKGQTTNTTGRAYKVTPEDWDQPCYIDGVTKGGQAGKTSDWQVTVSASGQASAVCHWK